MNSDLSTAQQQQRKASGRVKSRNILINVSLLIVSTIITLVLSEAALRLLGFDPLYVSPERDRFWRYDELLGWAHEPGQEGLFETEQFRTAVRINEQGLRDNPHPYERQNDNRRILVLGDSFAWGYGVEESQRFSELLEVELGAEVINAGVSGYSTDQELIWYQNEGVKYDVDLVILVLAGNDLGDNHKQLVSTIYYKPRFVLEDGELVATGYPVPTTSPQGRFVYSLSQRSALAYFLIQRYFDLRGLYSGPKLESQRAVPTTDGTRDAQEPYELTVALIDEIKSLAESKNATFMVVSTSKWWNLRSGDTYEAFVDVMQSEGFLVLDVESMSGFDPETMVIPDDGHWSGAGHSFVASQIKAFIEAHELLGQP